MDNNTDTCNPKGFERGLYTWERFGNYGAAVVVEVKPLVSITVEIAAVGPDNSKRLVQTSLRIAMNEYSCRIDLQGNKYCEEYPFFHGKGMATCAVNTGIQFLKPFYSTHVSIDITGEISNVDDQNNSDKIQQTLAAKRRAFWQRFGFRIWSNDKMRCGVSELKYVTKGLMLDEFPRLLTSGQFTKDILHETLYSYQADQSENVQLRDVIPKSEWINRPIQYYHGLYHFRR